MGFVGGGSGEGSGNGVGAGSGSGCGSGFGGCGSEFMNRLQCTIYTVHGLGSYSHQCGHVVHRFNKWLLRNLDVLAWIGVQHAATGDSCGRLQLNSVFGPVVVSGGLFLIVHGPGRAASRTRFKCRVLDSGLRRWKGGCSRSRSWQSGAHERVADVDLACCWTWIWGASALFSHCRCPSSSSSSPITWSRSARGDD